MQAAFWGVRGSIACSNPSNHFYGANTSCIELRTKHNELLIFDAGTGIHDLGRSLPNEGTCHIFISHGHSDHIQGLPFFRPLYMPNWKIHLYLPEWLEDLPHRVFDGNGFPLLFHALNARVETHILTPEKTFTLSDVQESILISTFSANHPGKNMAYKVYADDATFFYSGDHEISNEPEVVQATEKMLQDVTVAIVDATFSRQNHKKGWGHSAWEDWVELAKKHNIHKLILSHHNPNKTDLALDTLQKKLDDISDEYTKICLAREGMFFSISRYFDINIKYSTWLQDFLDSLGQYKDESILLDRILAKTREISNADAGTFFLLDNENNELFFAYSHNASIFPVNGGYKSAYVDMRLPLNTKSIAGYTAVTQTVLNLPDVYSLPEGVPYTFNRSFDETSGYRSHSMLTMPIVSHEGKILAVLQLINSINPRNGEPQVFSENIENEVRLLTREAAAHLEQSALRREGISQLMRIISMHDPTETGPHANRVGAIAAELYQRWAEKRNIKPEQLRHYKSNLRLAAMLHDIGKVGISDLVLKKNGALTEEEFNIIRIHPELGATIFSKMNNDISSLTYEVIINHHQKWDGTGYPKIADGKGLKGEQIPLSARLTAIADVFDALVSPRCYKKAFGFERSLDILQQESGSHFDPELVILFHEIIDTVAMIYKRFPDTVTTEC